MNWSPIIASSALRELSVGNRAAQGRPAGRPLFFVALRASSRAFRRALLPRLQRLRSRLFREAASGSEHALFDQALAVSSLHLLEATLALAVDDADHLSRDDEPRAAARVHLREEDGLALIGAHGLDDVGRRLP